MPDEILQRLNESIARQEELTAAVRAVQLERHADIDVQQRLTAQLIAVQSDQRRDRRRTYVGIATGIIAVLGVIGSGVQTFRLNDTIAGVNRDRAANSLERCRGINAGFERLRDDVRSAVEGIGAEVNASPEPIARVIARLSTPASDLDCNGDAVQTSLDYLEGFAPDGLPVPTQTVPD